MTPELAHYLERRIANLLQSAAGHDGHAKRIERGDAPPELVQRHRVEAQISRGIAQELSLLKHFMETNECRADTDPPKAR